MSNADLLAAYESACALAARLYADGCDTTEADTECDRLEAELRERGLA